MKTPVHPDQFNRLAIAVMEHYHTDYDRAIEQLEHLQLTIDCGEAVAHSINLQITLLSAINAGKRAFLGGVFVKLPVANLTHLTPLPGPTALSVAIQQYGGHLISDADKLNGFTLTLGKRCEISDASLEMIVGDWQGGVATASEPISVDQHDHLPMGAVAAAAIGVGCAFFKSSGIAPRCADISCGISLWRPDVLWLSPEANGPAVSELPAKAWLLGLGHLGQAYLWNLACLPFKNRKEVQLMLQDDDRATVANYSAGLLTEKDDVDQLKTRVCRKWLETAGFDTRLTERRFNELTRTCGTEPVVALCGFDNALSRQYLENVGFDLIVEAGLGGTTSNFDDIVLHTFPSQDHRADELWNAKSGDNGIHHTQVFKVFEDVKEEGCGKVPIELSGKAISSAFVGLLAGALATGELVRACCCGPRFQEVHARISSLYHTKAFEEGHYMAQMARNGTVATLTESIKVQHIS